MRLAIAQTEPTALERAMAYARGKPSISASTMARDLGIQVSVAKNFMARMARDQIITQPNDVGRSIVLAAPKTREELDGRVATVIGLVETVSEATGISPADLIDHARSGLLEEVVEQVKANHDAPSFQSDDVITGAARTRLRTIVERIERLIEDRNVVMEDMKEVYAEAKGEGFDTKILRKVIKIRSMDKTKRDEEDALLDLYLSAIGA